MRCTYVCTAHAPASHSACHDHKKLPAYLLVMATAASLEELRNFPFANDDATIANLAQELPLYLAASDGVTVTCEDDKLTWWANHKDTLPHWSSLVKKLLLIQPSSASAERVFSLLTNAFGSQQESSLQDYLEASVMLRYNNAKRV